jgi:hypothetical protein
VLSDEMMKIAQGGISSNLSKATGGPGFTEMDFDLSRSNMGQSNRG